MHIHWGHVHTGYPWHRHKIVLCSDSELKYHLVPEHKAETWYGLVPRHPLKSMFTLVPSENHAWAPAWRSISTHMFLYPREIWARGYLTNQSECTPRDLMEISASDWFSYQWSRFLLSVVKTNTKAITNQVDNSANLKQQWNKSDRPLLNHLKVIPHYYPTALRRIQITPKTSTNITRYLYSRGPVRQVSRCWPIS